jgi:cytochrome c-type biogenesis protein CcmH/NrfG
VSGDGKKAEEEYRQSLEADSNDALAAGNLALIESQQHHYAEAARLWRDVFSHDPVELGAGLNLAVVECAEGQQSQAIETLSRLLTFAPDNDRARAMLEAIRSGEHACGSK